MATTVALEAFGPTQPNQLFLPDFPGTKFFLKLQSLLEPQMFLRLLSG
jgi:hypothetical protein